MFALYFPTSQLGHALERPDTSLYFPVSQSVHAVRSVLGPYFPGTHLSQDVLPWVGPNLPDAQDVQVLSETAPNAMLNFPSLHKVHIVCPVEGVYDPALHCVHSVWPSNIV